MLLLSAAAVGVAAAQHVRVPFDIQRTTPAIEKRGSEAYDLVRPEDDFQFYVDFELGSDKQPLRGWLDTTSGDTWVASSSNPWCPNAPDAHSAANALYCLANFTASLLSSFVNGSNAFSVEYVDSTGAWGTYANDTLTVGNTTIENFTFGYATESNRTFLSFGIGLRRGEAMWINNQSSGAGTYTNFPFQLKANGLIERAMYSIKYDNSTSTGEVLFGAIDYGELTNGELYQVAMVQYDNTNEPVYRPAVYVASISHYNSSNPVFEGLLAVRLNSALAFTYLPAGVVYKLATLIGATYNSNAYYMKCSEVPSSGDSALNMLKFVFDQFYVNVAVENLFQYGYTYGGADYCAFTILPALDPRSLSFGQNFLSLLYLVVDLESEYVYVGFRPRNPSKNVVEVKAASILGAIAPEVLVTKVTVSQYDLYSGSSWAMTTEEEDYSTEDSATESTEESVRSSGGKTTASPTSEAAAQTTHETPTPNALTPTVLYTRTITDTTFTDFPLTTAGGKEYTVTTRVTVNGARRGGAVAAGVLAAAGVAAVAGLV